MAMERNYGVWEADARLLQSMWDYLLPQSPVVQIRLPKAVAAEVLAAWQRDDGEGNLPKESLDQGVIRDQAATLALIGLAIESTGAEEGDEVVFELDAWVLGNALSAADWADRPWE